MPSYYELLGVSKTASLDEIINAYESKKEELIKEYGTALNAKGAVYFKAYTILSNEKSRAEYDKECKIFSHQQSGVYDKLIPMIKDYENLCNKAKPKEQSKDKTPQKEPSKAGNFLRIIFKLALFKRLQLFYKAY